jgi:hypothetical protein
MCRSLRHVAAQILEPALEPDFLAQDGELSPQQLNLTADGADPVFRLVGEPPHDLAGGLAQNLEAVIDPRIGPFPPGLPGIATREQQSRLGSFSSRVDVPSPEGFQPLTSYKTANNHREFMIDDKLVADLRKRFEATPARRLTRAV